MWRHSPRALRDWLGAVEAPAAPHPAVLRGGATGPTGNAPPSGDGLGPAQYLPGTRRWLRPIVSTPSWPSQAERMSPFLPDQSSSRFPRLSPLPPGSTDEGRPTL